MANETKPETKQPEKEPVQNIDRSKAKPGAKPWKCPTWLYMKPDIASGVLCNTEAEYNAAIEAGGRENFTEAWK